MGPRIPAGQIPPPDDLTDLAESDRIHRQRPRSLLLLTRYIISVWRRPLMSRRAVRALVAEQEGAAALPDPARATHGEVVVHSIARRKADGVLHSTYQRLSRLLRRTDRLRAKKATLNARIGLIPREHVAHPYGGHSTVEQTQADRNALAARVNAERARNSRKHNRLPRWFRHLPRVVLYSTSCCFCTSYPASLMSTGSIQHHRSWHSRSPWPP